MKRLFMSIAAALLLCTAPPSMGGALTPEAVRWSRSQSEAAEWAEVIFGTEKREDSRDNRKSEKTPKILGQFILDVSAYLPNICVMVTPLKYEGTSINSMRLDFGEKGIEDDVAFDSPVNLGDLDVALYYGVPIVKAISRDKLNLDVGVKLRTIDVDASLNREPVERASEGSALPLPMIFAIVKFHPLAAVSLEAEGRGISMDGKTSYGLTGRLHMGAFGPVYAAGGYRFSKYEIEHDGLAIDAVINGPFLEAGLSF
ncbi:MAG: hypothetical protein WAK95_22235 [Desulfobacterales bacterium]